MKRIVKITALAEAELHKAIDLGLLNRMPKIAAYRVAGGAGPNGVCMLFSGKHVKRDCILRPLVLLAFAAGVAVLFPPILIAFTLYFPFVLVLPVETLSFFIGPVGVLKKYEYIIIVSNSDWEKVLQHEALHVVEAETKLQMIVHSPIPEIDEWSDEQYGWRTPKEGEAPP